MKTHTPNKTQFLSELAEYEGGLSVPVLIKLGKKTYETDVMARVVDGAEHVYISWPENEDLYRKDDGGLTVVKGLPTYKSIGAELMPPPPEVVQIEDAVAAMEPPKGWEWTIQNGRPTLVKAQRNGRPPVPAGGKPHVMFHRLTAGQTKVRHKKTDTIWQVERNEPSGFVVVGPNGERKTLRNTGSDWELVK